jgi:hypothetical protein
VPTLCGSLHDPLRGPVVNPRCFAAALIETSYETPICRLFQDSESGLPGLHSVEEIGDVVCDVVADQAHAFDAVDRSRPRVTTTPMT